MPYETADDSLETLNRALAILHQFGKDLMWMRTMAARLELDAIPETAQRRASLIREMSEDMSSAVRDLLKPSCDEHLAATTAVEKAIRVVERTHGRSLGTPSLGEGVSQLSVDSRTTDVVANLLHNAVEATDARDHVELEVNAVEGAVHIQVRDSGPGMDSSVLNRCFERGFTTKAREGGTGIGLYASRQLAKAIGARLEIESDADRGTAARLTVPARTAEPASRG